MELRFRGDTINDDPFQVPGVDEVGEDEIVDYSVGPMEEHPLPSLDATWSVLHTEPGLDEIMETAKDSL